MIFTISYVGLKIQNNYYFEEYTIVFRALPLSFYYNYEPINKTGLTELL